MRRAIQLLKIVLSIVGYAVLAPFGYVAFVLVAATPTRDRTRRARRFQTCIFRGFRFMHDWLRVVGLIDYQPRRIEGVVPTQPVVLVANHPTWTDVTAIMSSLRDVSALIRETTFDRWWLRPLLQAAGQIRSPLQASGVADMTEDVRDRLARGFHVLAFPEGQRSPSETSLREFARAPFEAAFRAGVPVVPVAIRVDPPFLTKQRGIGEPPDNGSRLRVRYLPPVDPSGMRSSRELRDRVREVLAEAAARPMLESSTTPGMISGAALTPSGDRS